MPKDRLMPKLRQRAREQARVLFLSGELSSNAAIARRLEVRPHTVGRWRREESWDELRLKADRRAAEKLVEQLATDRADLNSKHFKLWEALLSRAVALFKDKDANTIAGLERIAGILDRAQKGQRLAKEIATAAEAADTIRVQAAADVRTFVDVFIAAVKEHVSDEATREKLREAILRGLPEEPAGGPGKPGDESVH